MSKIIALEGIDGSGKTTQAQKIATFLQSKGIHHINTGEPRHTIFGAKIIEASYGLDISTTTSKLLYEAIRSDHLDTVVMPALADKKIVICDRFFLSTMAYNNEFVKGGKKEYIDTFVNEITKYNLKSIIDHFFVINILIDVTLDAAIERIKCRNDRFDDFWQIKNPIENLSRVKDAYSSIFKYAHIDENDWSIKYIVNGNEDENQVFDQILYILNKEFNLDKTT